MARGVARGIEADCTQLLYRFYYYLDEFRYRDVAELFVADGVWHRAGQALQGRDQIIAALERRSTTQRVRHVVTNLLIEAGDDATAQIVFYLTAYQHDAGIRSEAPAKIGGPSLLLVVTATLVKAAAGWRIARQTTKREFEFAD